MQPKNGKKVPTSTEKCQKAGFIVLVLLSAHAKRVGVSCNNLALKKHHPYDIIVYLNFENFMFPVSFIIK